MSSPNLEKHRKAFEDSFFPKEQDALRLELRDAEIARFDELLEIVSGAHDPAILEKLEALGIGTDTLAALTLFPLVIVAWADENVDHKERALVLEAAHEAGMAVGSLSHRMLERWLEEAPDPRILPLWKSYVGAVAAALGPEWRATLEERILALCERVAEATGGFLALDKVSTAEYRVLAELREPFETER